MYKSETGLHMPDNERKKVFKEMSHEGVELILSRKMLEAREIQAALRL